MSSTFFTSWSLPLFIFLARVLDVSLGTLRIIALSRGQKRIAPLLGFVEVFIWVVAVSQLVRGINDLSSYLAYAAGFAVGNYLGIFIEEKLALGTLTVRIFAVQQGEPLAAQLQQAGYGVTVLDGHGSQGPIKILFSTIHRRELPEIVSLIQRINPQIFYSVEEVRSSSQGVFHSHQHQHFIKRFDWSKKK